MKGGIIMIQGQCHCGNVTIVIPELTETGTSCNCSICSRYGSIWGYFTEKEVKVSVGEHAICSYSHGEKTINFIHCSRCGCVTHYTSSKSAPDARLAVNYRMFGPSVLQRINVRFFDGADTWKYLDWPYPSRSNGGFVRSHDLYPMLLWRDEVLRFSMWLHRIS